MGRCCAGVSVLAILVLRILNVIKVTLFCNCIAREGILIPDKGILIQKSKFCLKTWKLLFLHLFTFFCLFSIPKCGTCGSCRSRNLSVSKNHLHFILPGQVVNDSLYLEKKSVFQLFALASRQQPGAGGMGHPSRHGYRAMDAVIERARDELCKNSSSRKTDSQYTLRRPLMNEVLSTRIWGVPPAGGPLL